MRRGELPPILEERLEKMIERHPGRRSICGVVLAEMISAQASLADRSSAANIYLMAGCKRGLQALHRLAMSLHAEWEEILEGPRDYPTGARASLFVNVLIAIAQIDTPESHSRMMEYLGLIQNVHLRSSVLEAMAFEVLTFDLEAITPFLSPETEEPLLLSALYALWFRHEPPVDKVQLRPLLLPLLSHPSAFVRTYTVQTVMFDDVYDEAISGMANDPDLQVREAVAEWMRLFSSDEDSD